MKAQMRDLMAGYRNPKLARDQPVFSGLANELFL